MGELIGRRRIASKTLVALCAAAGLLTTPLAGAQSTQIGTVSRIHVRAPDGLIYFYVDGPRSPVPSCATQPYWVIASEASNTGKQQLAMLMMAEAAGKPVTIYGAGSCGRWPDGESVAEIAVSD